VADKTDTPIYIDLDKERIGGTDPKENPTDLLQRDAVKKVLRYLVEETDTGRSSQNIARDQMLPGAPRPNHRHDTIMVDGERGGGKSTFVVNILETLTDEGKLQSAIHRLEIKRTRKDTPNLHSLGIFDPTILEDKQNIVILIINRIQSAVESAKHNAKRSTQSSTSPQHVDQKLHSLARGLSHLSGVGGETIFGEKWLDPDFVLDEGLEHAHAGDNLGQQLAAYIEAAAEFLAADAFVLAVDDIDTAFHRGWPVLEAIRKYLVTPKLKIILSGDLELYRILVRQQQFDMLSQNMLTFERKKAKPDQAKSPNISNLPHIERKFNELEDQYLTKLLPPGNRHRLRNLYQLIYVDSLKIRFTWAEQDDSQRVSGLARNFLRRYARRVFAVRQPDTQIKYIHAILSEPVRSSLRILADGLNIVPTSVPGAQEDRAQACEALRQTAISALSNSGVEPRQLVIDAPRNMIAHYVVWFLNANDWRTLPRLYPEYQDNARNIAACAGAASLVEAFRRDPSGVFEYLAKIAITRELHDSGRVPEPHRNVFIEHIMLSNGEPSYNTAGRMAAWLRSTSERPQLLNYMTPYAFPVSLGRPKDFNPVFVNLLGVRYTAQPQKKTKPQHNYKKMNFDALRKTGNYGNDFWTEERINGLPLPLRSFHRNLVGRNVHYVSGKSGQVLLQGRFYNSLESLEKYIPDSPALTALWIPFFKIVNEQGFEYGTFSITRFDAFFESMMALFTESKDDGNQLKAEVEARLDSLIIQRSYPVPDSHGARATLETEEDEEPNAPEEEDDDAVSLERAQDQPVEGQPTLSDAIAAWLRFHAGRKDAERFAAAPITLARIATRFHYVADGIGEALRHLQTRYLGIAIHRYVIARLHAFAVELARADDIEGIGKRSATNPITTSNPLQQILETFYPGLFLDVFLDGDIGESDEERKAPWLFDFIFSCPIWGFYLCHNDEISVMRSGDGNEQSSDAFVFKFFRGRLQQVLGWSAEDIDALFQCHYQPDGHEKRVTFNNLLTPLNTVPIQGQNPRQRLAGGLFTDVLAE